MPQAGKDVVCQDRTGKPIRIGDRVRVQHCVGRYGETQVDEGELIRVDAYGGVTLKLARPTRQVIQNVVTRPQQGALFYIAGGTRTGRHEDFEHAHEYWIEKQEDA